MVAIAIVQLCLCLGALVAAKGRHTPILDAEFAVDLQDSITVITDKTHLHHSSEWVAVSWTGVVNPKPNDWIGLYSPADADVLSTAPVKLKFASQSASHLESGSGTLLFSVLNMRADLRFVLFRGGISAPVQVAASPAVAFDNPNEPVAARLSLYRPGQLRLSWTSRDVEQPSVQYWVDGRLHLAPAATVTYESHEMCGPPASGYGWRDPGRIHHAVLDQLRPSITFQYRYGSNRTGWSHIRTGRVPPAAGPNAPVAFYAFGDLGTAPPDGALQPFWTQAPSRRSTNFMANNMAAADFVLHIGDISYAVGFQATWDGFLDQIAPIAQALPYQMAIGNHERDYEHSQSLFEGDDSGGECGVPYQRLFPAPGSADVAANQTWYSFESGPVHIVVMSTEHDFRRGTNQYAFLLSDLQAVDRTRTPWVIVAGHRPMYVDTVVDVYGDASEKVVSELLRRELEDLLLRFRVDLALWGHDHSYQRSCPVYNQICIEADAAAEGDGYQGPVHLLIGSAGMDLSPDGSRSPPAWLNNRIDDFGIGLIQANATDLLFQFISDGNEQVLDEVRLVRRAKTLPDPVAAHVAIR